MGQLVHLDPLGPDPQLIELAASIIRGGGVVCHPTDTVYGLSCSPFDDVALERVFSIKGRGRNKGVLVLVPTVDWVQRLASSIPPGFSRLSDQLWPGPVTFLLPANDGLPSLIRGEKELVGVRRPDHAFLLRWMENIPGPLVSTSANLSGRPPAQSVDELRQWIAPQVDLFIEATDLGESLPSTVLDLSIEPPQIVRAGVMSEQVSKVIGGQ
jgi:L-threonylcarbamoyladenylate synthase